MRGDKMFSDFVRQDIHYAYELYKEGAITLEQRERMIQEAKDKEYQESVLDISHIDPYLSAQEQLDEVKKLCYEKCAIGEISVYEREALITEYTNMYKDDIEYEMDVYTEATAAQFQKRRNMLKVAVGLLAAIFSMRKICKFFEKKAVQKRFPEIKEINYQIKILNKQIKTQKKMLSGELSNIKQGYNSEFMQADRVFDPILSNGKKDKKKKIFGKKKKGKKSDSNWKTVMSPKKFLTRHEEEKRNNMENRMHRIVDLNEQLNKNKAELAKLKSKLNRTVNMAVKQKDLFNASEIAALKKEMKILSDNAAFSTTIL